MARRARGVPARLAIALIAFGSFVGACSGAASPSPPPASPAPSERCADPLVARLREAVELTLAAGTVGFDQSMSFTGSTAFPDGPFGFMSGSASLEAPRQVTAETSFPNAPLGRLRVLILQDLLLMSGQYIDVVLGPGKWLLVDLRSGDPRAEAFIGVVGGHNDAFVALYFLYGPTGAVEDLGVEKVNGVTTRRWSADVSLEQAAECAPAAVSEHLLESAGSLGWGSTATADAWVDSEGRIRAINAVFDLTDQQGGGQLLIEYTFDDFGKPLDIVIPPDEDVVSLDDVPTVSPPVS